MDTVKKIVILIFGTLLKLAIATLLCSAFVFIALSIVGKFPPDSKVFAFLVVFLVGSLWGSVFDFIEKRWNFDKLLRKIKGRKPPVDVDAIIAEAKKNPGHKMPVWECGNDKITLKLYIEAVEHE